MTRFYRTFRSTLVILVSALRLCTLAEAQLQARGSTSILIASDPASFAVADFNHDGKLDVAVAEAEVQIFLGNGDGTFQPSINYAVGTNPSSIAVADFNGDGKLDLAVTSYLSSTVSILFGNGDGTFQPPVTFDAPTAPTYIAAGDFNGDHKPDLVVLGNTTISVFLNKGDGSFGGPVSTPGGIGLGVGDFNRDGRLDLAVTRSALTSAWVAILLGNGDGTFTEGQTSQIPLDAESAVAVCDFRGDGRLDLAITDFIGAPGVSVLLGNGDGTFGAAVTYVSEFSVWATTGDLNGDGKPDIIVANQADNGYSTGSVSVLLGNGDGTFQPQIVFPAGPSESLSNFLAVGDFNGDHRLDVIDMDRWDGYLLTMLNTGDATFSPTSPLTFPTQLIGTTSAPLTATLTNSGTDAMTVSGATYSGSPFRVTKSTCKGTLSPGAHCEVTANFTAQVEGTVSGTVTFRDSASSKPQVVELVGTGTVVELSPARLTFAPQKVGTKSAPKNIRVTNTGSAALDFTHFIFISGNNYNDFSESDDCGTQIGPGASCDIKITFAPRKTGARRAFVQIEDSGGGSPQEPKLMGTGN